MTDFASAEDEIVQRAAWLFTHHGRYGRNAVIADRPDVFVVGTQRDWFDIAVRIDGSYASKAMAEGVAESWADNLRKLTRLLRTQHIPA